MTAPPLPLPAVLSIAGSDPSGGAGIQADLKVFSALGVYGMAAITALTIQNTRGVSAFHPVEPGIVAAQIQSVLEDIPTAAIKTGMLANEDIINSVAGVLADHPSIPLVIDPVLVSTSGKRLLEIGAERALKERLIPLAALVTPNLNEAEALSGVECRASLDSRKRAAEKIIALGCRAVLIKGGHLNGPASEDLWFDGAAFVELSAPRLDNPNTHGTGCALSAAITSFLARGELALDATRRAKHFLTECIRNAFPVGRGAGPVNPLWNISQ